MPGAQPVPAAQLAARDTQPEAVQARLAVLAEQIEDLRRQPGKDSSTSSKPPSSDSRTRSRSPVAADPVRAEAGQAAPGPAPPPPTRVTEYQVVAKKCPACGETATGAAPAGVTSLVQYGPEAHALLRQARVLYADETPARG